jgi:phosphoglycerate dehydrogenase-like enzyme
MINAPQLRQMRHHAFLINTARGPIVHEVALAQALGRVPAGCGPL